MPTPAPQRIGRFDIQELLGRGGMGSVYRAWDPSLKRTVALKQLTRIEGVEDVPRFLRETRLLARLDHRGICKVYEQGTAADGRPFMVMDLINGQPLDQVLSETSLAPKQAARIMVKVARAVHHAHEEDILHRDLKPHNIILREENGEPVLLDFGLARLYESVEEQITHSQDLRVAGTPAYMSPEQVNGEQATPLSDVFSLGATLYHALSGRPPFGSRGGPLPATLKQVLFDDPPPPSTLQPEVSQALDACCLKALSKEPSQRFTTADEFARALEDALEQPNVESSKTRVAAIGATAAIAMVFLGVALVSQRSNHKAEQQHSSSAMVKPAPAPTASALPVPALQVRWKALLQALVGGEAKVQGWPAVVDLDGDGVLDVVTTVGKNSAGQDARLIAVSGKTGQLLWTFDDFPTNTYMKPVVDRLGGRSRVIASVLLENRSPGVVWLDGRHGTVVHKTAIAPALTDWTNPPWNPVSLDLAGTGERGVAVNLTRKDELLIKGLDSEGNVAWTIDLESLGNSGIPVGPQTSRNPMAVFDASGDGHADSLFCMFKGVGFAFKFPSAGEEKVREHEWMVRPDYNLGPLATGEGPSPAPDGQSGFLILHDYLSGKQNKLVVNPVTGKTIDSRLHHKAQFPSTKWTDVEEDGKSRLLIFERDRRASPQVNVHLWDPSGLSAQQTTPIGGTTPKLYGSYTHPDLGRLLLVRQGNHRSPPPEPYKLELRHPETGKVAWSQITGYVSRITIADLDGDGRAEIVATTNSPGSILVIEAPKPSDRAPSGE